MSQSPSPNLRPTPIVLSIAGSDSGGGAGIQADIKAASANGAYCASVLTAITAQNTQAVAAVHAVPLDIVRAQIQAVLTDLDVSAIKIGMLFSTDVVCAVADALADFRGKVIVDPVMIAKSGDALLQTEAVAALKSELLPRADILTPNLPEVNALLLKPENDPVDAIEDGKVLQRLGAKNVLIKGGHADSDSCTDHLLLEDGQNLEFSAPRIDTHNTHGTGCTYSSSIAAWLARGFGVAEATRRAHAYLHEAIKTSDRLRIGRGHGPVNHFHAYWTESECSDVVIKHGE